MNISFSSFQQYNVHSGAYLAVEVGELHCFIELHQVYEALSLVALQPVPDAPDYLAGIMNYKGVAVPVIDLLLRLGQQQNKKYTLKTFMLLCKTMEQDNLLALIVSDIGNIIDVKNKNLQLIPEFSDKQLPFSALLNQQQQTSLILDTEVLWLNSLSFLDSQSPEDLRRVIQSLLD